MWDTIKEYVKSFFNSRLLPVAVVYVLLFALLINRLFDLQIVESSTYIAKSESNQTRTREIKATRGNIYDCKGVLLAYNKLSYNVTYEDQTAVSSMTNEEKNAMIYKLIQIIEKNNGTISIEFYLEQNSKGDVQFNVSGNARLRFIAEVYSTTVQKMTKDQKDASAQEIYDFLRDTQGKASANFGIDSKYGDEETLKIMAIRYAMFINRYTKYEPIVIAKNVNDATVSAVKENSSIIPGFTIAQDTKRVYKKSKYFAHMLGYTGSISAEKLDSINAKDPNNDYSTDDQIGLSGLESQYEEYLRGTKGSQKLSIDESTSRVISTSDVKEPTAGNDMYLTIDSKLQEQCYRQLESHIAGVLISNINNSTDAGTRGHSTKNIKVPIYDVYNALVENNIVDVTRFTEDDASPLEKSTYKNYLGKRKVVLNLLRNKLAPSSTITAKKASKQTAEFLDYFYTVLKDNKIVLTSKVDTNDATYKQFAAGKLSVSKFLQYAIPKQWIDTKALKLGKGYYSTVEIYNKLVNYGIKLLQDDNKFTKMVYSYMIYNYNLSGRDLCLLLFDQGDIKYNETEYNQLKSGVTSAYAFLIRKIRKLQITPGELGLDPCSGSLIVTDVKTGQVKAMVTYPSYDNNKMANQVDSKYYNRFLTDSTASPLLNRPVQQKLAPGSTFKVISSVAALEEGVLGPGTKVHDNVTFTQITPSPHCWSSYSHGDLTVATALEVSCNYFFYNVGYLLSGGKVHGRINYAKGLSRLKKYANMFGLTSTSGVELPETEPHFADGDAIRAAIGQDSNSYAPAQLSRYVTTVANNGTCYNLTLVKSIKNVNGKTILNNKAKVRNKVNIKQSTWDAIHKGMYLVVNGGMSSHKAQFAGVQTTVAGKTGTAQQTTLHPNHAYFISYAPYKKPKISVTCVIPNGFTSDNAAATASDIYRYYFNKGKKKNAPSQAKLPTGGSGVNEG